MEIEEKESQIKKDSQAKARSRYQKYKHLAQKYYHKNRDAIRVKQKAYREKNKDRIREWQKKPKYRKTRDAWHIAHKEYTQEYQKKYYHEVVKPKREAAKNN